MPRNPREVARLYLLGLFLLSACYFPHDSYVNPAIRPPGVVQAGLDIANLTDPHPLIYPTTFSFDVITGGKQIMLVEVFKDGESWIQSNNPTLNFELDPANHSDDTHDILIKVRLSSGSQSIAELLQAEYYEFEKGFRFTVDKTTPQPVSGITTALENGKLVVRWEKPDHKHFEYVIQRKYFYADNSTSQKQIRIKDQSLTEFIDDCFTGGSVTYSIHLESPSFSVPSAAVNFSFEPVALNATMDENNVVRVSWTQPYDFGDSVYLEVMAKNQTTRFSTVAGNVVVDTLILGDHIPVSFKIIREGYEPEGYQKDFTFQPGLRIKPFDNIHLLPSNKLILTKGYSYEPNRTWIYRYDAASMVLEDSLVLSKGSAGLVISADGLHAYLLYYANYMQSEPVFIKFNPLNLSEPSSEVKIPLYYNGNYLVSPRQFSVSNGNVLLFQDYRYSNPRVIQVDLNTKALTWYRENVSGPVFSPDGSLMVMKDGDSGQLWKKNGSTWELSATVPAGNFYFSTETAPRLIVTSHAFTSIYDPNDTSTGSVLQPVHTSAIAVTGYDPQTNSLLSQSFVDDSVSVIKVLNMELIEKFKVRANGFHDYPNYTHIYTGSGHYISSGFMEKL